MNGMITFQHNPPVKPLMVFEQEFEPELRLSYSGKLDVLGDMDEVIAGYIDGELFFEWYGARLGEVPHVDEPCNPGQPEYPEMGYRKWDPESTFYCYSNELLKKFQRKGLGTICKAYTLGYLKALGYQWVTGHANLDGSIQLNEKFGAERIHEFKNWYDTGSTYILYAIDLRR